MTLELPLCLSTMTLEAYRSTEVVGRVFFGEFKYVDRFVSLANFIPRECGPQHLAAGSVCMPCSRPGKLWFLR